MLVDAHKNQDMFTYVAESMEEANLPKAFPLGDSKQPAGEACIVSQKEFERNLDLFTESQLRFMNWDNVFLAGGTPLACLRPLPGEHGKDNVARRNYYHRLAYKSSDVDLFIYGLDEAAANKKVEEVYNSIRESIPQSAIAFRSTHAITIVSQFPYRHIQIVLRLYKSPAEILMGFDVDACSVGYDGKSVWMTPRCHRAITHQYNTVDMSRRSPSYEMRLAKYSERGFAVLVPSLDRNRIDPQLFERRFDQLQGLAKLLLLESLQTAEARTTYKEQQRLRKLRPAGAQKASFWTALDPRFNDDFSRERLEAEGGADASDYSTVFLPWGPNWTAEKIRRMMYTKDMILNSKWYDPKKKHHTHPCFFGTVSEVVKDCCGHCPVPTKEQQEQIETMFVAGPMQWVTVNPGSQSARIGSFHPITEGDWTEGAYVSPNTEIMCSAITRNDVATVKACLEGGVNVNMTDPAGRTPLHIAAFVGSVDVAKELIANGARISKRTSEGRTALMIAAQYGHAALCKVILARGKELEAELAANPALAGGDKPKKKAQSPKKKKRPADEDEEMDEDGSGEGSGDEEMDEDGSGEGSGEGDGDEDGEGDGDEEMDDDFEGIAVMIARKKKQAQEEAEAADPSAKGDEGPDKLDVEDTDWDFKMTAHHYAVFFGKNDCVRLLLENGFKADRQLHFVNSENGTKFKTYTLLHLALINNHIKTLELLLELGAPIGQLDLKSENVLHKAASLLNLDACVILTEWKKEKLDINAFGQGSKTALTKAMASTAHSSVNVDGEDRTYKDPCTDQKYEVVEYLISVGAKIAFDEKDLPADRAQPGHHGGFGGGAKNKALSTRAMFRNFLGDNMPIVVATCLMSPRLIKLLLDNKVNLKFPLKQMPLDIVQKHIENTESSLKEDPISKAYLSYLKKQKPGDKSSYSSFEFKKFYANAKQHRGRGFRVKRTPRVLPGQAYSAKATVNPEDEQKKYQQHQLKTWKAIQKLLQDAGAQKLAELKLTAQDDDLKNQLAQPKHGGFGFGHQQAPKHEKPTYTYSNIAEAIPGMYRSNQAYEQSVQANYFKFFNAVWNGSEKEIKTLCETPAIGKQVHVASFVSSNSGFSALQLAILKNHPNTIRELLRICTLQFTPIATGAAVESEKTRALNNYELAALMDRIKPGEYLNKAGHSVNQALEKVDPNAPKTQLNCVTSPASVILFKNGRSQDNVAHIAARYGCADSLKALLSFIKDNDVKVPKYTTTDTKAERNPTTLLDDLLSATNNKNLTPFETALATGNIEIAEILLQAGCLTAGESIADEDEYQGLDVGGKKMDWALEHHAPTQKKEAHAAIHIAATYNKGKSLHFLLTKGEGIWNKVKPKGAPDRGHFSLATADAEGNTAYHWIIAKHKNDAAEAVKALIANDGTKVFDKPNNEGITPLHLAAAQGADVILKLLVTNSSTLAPVDKQRGWTPLHFAVCLAKPECANILLAALSAKEVDTKSSTFQQTPLVVSAHYGSINCVTALLNSGKCDANATDACGESAIHHAIKQGHRAIFDLLMKSAKQIDAESGLGLNTLDVSMQLLLKPFIHHRDSNNQNDATPIPNQIEMFQDLEKKKLSDSRTLCNLEDVNRFSRIMIDKANEIADKSKKDITRHRWRRHHNSQAVGIDTHSYDNIQPNVHFADFSESESDSESEEDKKDDDEDGPSTLKGCTIALSGTLTMKRADAIALIKKHGGTYATTVTKAVTHVVVADPNEDTSKINEARASGKKIVSEKFFANL